MEGSNRRWIGAIAGGGDQSQVEESNRRWVGAITDGGDQWQVEGSNSRWTVFLNPDPAHWTSVDKNWLKLEKYTLIPGLRMPVNFFLGFNDALLVRKLVKAVSRLQPSFPGLFQDCSCRLLLWSHLS